MSFFSGLSLNKIGGAIFGRPGPSNPYNAVDFASLYAQDLEKPGAAYDYGGAYKTLIDMIGSPSSVEAVQQDVEGQQMKELMGLVDTQTKGAYGSTISDMADRGLVGEGQSSDIAANALAQIQGQGAQTKSDIGSQYALARLQRLFGKEQAAQSAQQNYATLLGSMAESARTRGLNRLLGLSGQQADAYTQSVEQQYKLAQPGIWETSSRKGADAFGEAYGRGMGSGLAMLSCFHPDTKIKMANGCEKRIGDVVLGDVTSGGKTVSVRRAYADGLCQLGNVMVTESHCVLDNGEWKRVGDVAGIKKIEGTHEVVNLVVENHIIESGGMVFDDEEETVDDRISFPTKQAHVDYLNKYKRG